LESFSVLSKKQLEKVRNPQHGKKLTSKQRNVVKFKAGSETFAQVKVSSYEISIAA